VSNFNWLPFTPLWSPSPVLHNILVSGRERRQRDETLPKD
jgi:hypothetical protein